MIAGRLDRKASIEHVERAGQMGGLESDRRPLLGFVRSLAPPVKR